VKSRHSKAVAFVVLLALTSVLVFPPFASRGAGSGAAIDPQRVAVPNVDVNATAAGLRKATATQLAAIDQFKNNYGSQATIRWNSFAGSPDVIRGFHTSPSNDTPENVARSFVAANSTLFGVDPSALVLVDKKEALGGYLIRFQQQAGGVNVLNGGLGFLLTANKEIRLVMGSTFREPNITSAPALSADAAAASAQVDIARYSKSLPSGFEQAVKPAFDALQQEIAPVLRAPKLNVFPTADGYQLAWNVIGFSRNPFGLFVTQVDAGNGKILARENKVLAQNPLPYTADIFPNHPELANPDTGELKQDGNGPTGLLRVQLRGYNEGTNATGVAGVMSGPHALIKNVLATQQPFAQAALGTWHFRQNNAPLEAQPNEADDLAEPAEHIDDVNIFFFVNYLVEYMMDIHRRADTVHNRIGQGDFPDNFPNSDRPLVGLPHFPSDGGAAIGGEADTSSPDAALRSMLGLDNAFSVPASQTVDTPTGPQTVIVNPTVYGHGYLFNDLGKDGAVVYHEGTHSISTPIAGLEGSEGGALNEAQADLWAYTITNAEAIGEYSVQGSRARQAVRDGLLFANDTGGDPDRLAWIRSAHATLKYSQLGTRGGNGFEVHRDGEIYVSTMWDLRHLMIAAEPEMRFKRPAFLDGTPTKSISQGQETWERLHLGSIYLLGLTSPDTFIKFRDAVLEADRVLYSTDPTNLDAPGQHESLIWQVFASHEMGVNADSVIGGRQTISTRVPQFAVDQAHPGAPQGITVEPASAKTIKVSWQPVSGAFGYEVFKRKVGSAGQRQFAGAPLHAYFDGDSSTNGWSHVTYVADGSTSYEDKGSIAEFFGPAGLKSTSDAAGFNELLGTEYAVRAISLNPNRQVGVSDLSAGTAVNANIQDVTSQFKASIANPVMAGGVFEFDQTLRNDSLTSIDGIAYSPINFKIVSISDPTVKVINADNGGDGQANPALFVYNQSLANGATSSARHLKFSNPNARLFTVNAVITARVRTAPVAANGSQAGDGAGSGIAPADERFTSQTETLTGIMVVGSAGLTRAAGVDYVDIPFVAKPNSFGVDGAMDTFPASLGPFPDLDLQLRDTQGNILSTSGNLGPKEFVSGAITPGKTYIYRVVGYINGPTQVNISSKQYFPSGMAPSGNGGGSGGAGLPLPTVQGSTALRVMQFTINPLTKTVSIKY
jgi:Fungalysin metallopeptidase (M36)